MRIQWQDDFGCAHSITSTNPEVISKWMLDQVRQMCSANVTINHPVRIDVWPETHDEQELIAEWHGQHHLSCDDISELADAFANAAKIIWVYADRKRKADELSGSRFDKGRPVAERSSANRS